MGKPNICMTKNCPLCAEQIPLEVATCEYCGAKFAVTITSYCTYCHDMREADESGYCLVCQHKVVDRRVESKLIEEQEPLPPAAQPMPVGVSTPSPAKRRSTWLWLLVSLGVTALIGMIAIKFLLTVGGWKITPISHTPITSTNASRNSLLPSNLKMCQVVLGTSKENPFEAAFNRQAESALQQAASMYNALSITIVPPAAADNDYANDAYQNIFIEWLPADCSFVVTTNLFLGDVMRSAAKVYPDRYFLALDYLDANETLPNLWAQNYAMDQVSFLAGYLAAAVSRTGKVGTFGGAQYPAITQYMDGFTLGVQYYNQKHGENSRVLGWDIATQCGLFIDDFGSPEKGKEMGDQLIAQGADILFPVAGRTSSGAALSASLHGNVYIIGTEMDWAQNIRYYHKITLTSTEKRLDRSVAIAIEALVNEAFKGGQHTGTLVSGEISLAPYYYLDNLVTPEIKADLIKIKADIILGQIKTKP